MRSKKVIHERMGTVAAIKNGFEKFFVENGHYPTALEIDACPYLCSTRWIQKHYGGLINFRKMLRMNVTSYGIGDNRRKIWEYAGVKSLETENSLKKYLISVYGELCVHEEIKVGNSRQRLDFFVYAKDNFAVDVFNTYTLKTLIRNLNIKVRKYTSYPFTLFFVVTGGKFDQKDINHVVMNKINKMPENIKCVTFENFKLLCKGIKPIKISAKYTSLSQLKLL